MTEIIAALIAAIATIMVWYLSAMDLAKKEREAKRREIRLTFLLDAYRKLESACHRKNVLALPYVANLEFALSEIQLLGSEDQAKMVKEVIQQLVKDRSARLDLLLDSL